MPELYKLEAELLLSEKIHYPLLKLVDIYFWHEGFGLEIIKINNYELFTNRRCSVGGEK